MVRAKSGSVPASSKRTGFGGAVANFVVIG
jgi:hypothetical protein